MDLWWVPSVRSLVIGEIGNVLAAASYSL